MSTNYNISKVSCGLTEKENIMNKLKEEFINAFGKEKWDELEILKPLQDAVDLVAKECLGIEPIPVVFDALPKDIFRYDFKLKAIIIN